MRVVRISVKDLRKILREEIMFEADKKDYEESGEDSLDSQVDRYLGDYEVEAKSVKTEGSDWHRTLRRLMEADEDEEDKDEEDEGDEDKDEEEEKDKEPPQGSIDDIDVETYVDSVMRLVENYDSLLEVRNTILRRASNFLNKNYKSNVVEAFHDHLKNEYGVEIGKSKVEYDADRFIAPVSDRAGGGGGGAG